MVFDEYEYLEKTVEEQQPPKEDDYSEKKKAKREGAEKSERSYRKREDSEEEEEWLKTSKRSRHEDDNGGRRERDRERENERDRERDKHQSRRDREKERDSERDRERSREKEKDKERREKDRDREKDREKEKERERRERREREKEKERERSSSRSRRSSSRSRRDSEREKEREREREIRERERDLEMRESRRYKEKKEVVEPEADPERDQRTVFAYQMPLKATERDVYEFFSKAGKVRDVRLIMDRNSRRSKGVGYIEFYDVMSVPMAIALSGQLLLGQPVMVKPSEAEKNLVPSNASAGGAPSGLYGAIDRKLYVGNLHFNMTEIQLRQLFEPFGPVELVQLPLDIETGQCKGFGFVQFAQLEHAKAAQSALNGKLEIAGRTIKVSSVTDHVGVQDTAAKSADFDDDDGGGLALNAQSRALLMQKLDRTGIATSIAGSLGGPMVNGTVANQQAVSFPVIGPSAVPIPAVTAPVIPAPVSEFIGYPSECLLLKNMFDPAAETDLDFDLEIKEDVEEECSKYGRVMHIHVDKNSAGFVYLQFESVEAAAAAQRAMHMRWFARRLISALFMKPEDYEGKFKG
ncbi:RNA-binding protein 39-like [Mangifera indica]|uniref:RNA-binding protein 39-like n=1 Tax=Mangifera indica TaxID=29780 RepID=UPI001CF9A6E2|nr:RNA-binding protein 39-like [Mangifera indica]XP_044463583.1 RNA-binding protein 39-like [Mangifera indica]